jgi:hypothetical protein
LPIGSERLLLFATDLSDTSHDAGTVDVTL